MQVPQPRPRIGAELLGEGGPDPLVRRQGLRLPAIGVQGSDQQLVQAFAEWVCRGEALEFGDHVAAVPARHGGFGEILGGAQPQFGQPVGLDPGEREVPQVGEGVATPEALGLGQQGPGLGRVTGEQAATA